MTPSDPLPRTSPHAPGPSTEGRSPEGQPVDIVGLHGGQWFGRVAEHALREADVLVGHQRQLDLLPGGLKGEPVELWGDLDEVLGFAAARRQAGQQVCILAAGDPGFFGLVRLAAARLGSEALRVHPAPSSVALAFARAGCHWDDAAVVSAHGRPLEHAVAAVAAQPKVAVLVSKDQLPEALGQALLAHGCAPREVTVCSRLGEPDESVRHLDLDGLSQGAFDPLSVVVFRAPEPTGAAAGGPGIAWGHGEDQFAHREGMITKAEVRAVALGKLELPRTGVIWDVGAASGSVAIECALLAPGARVFAVERRADDVARIEQNTKEKGVSASVTVVQGEAPQALASLPDPDRVFVGGGGLPVLDAVLDRVGAGSGGAPKTVVAAYATLATAAAAAERLGNVVQVQVSRGAAIGPDRQLRLAAENPVFICWGTVGSAR